MPAACRHRFALGMFTALVCRQPDRPDIRDWADQVEDQIRACPDPEQRLRLGCQLGVYYLAWRGRRDQAEPLLARLAPPDETGLTPMALLENIKRMKVEPATISKIALSHGHDDHTAAVADVIRAMDLHAKPRKWEPGAMPEDIRRYTQGRQVPVVVHPAAFRERWGTPTDGTKTPLSKISVTHSAADNQKVTKVELYVDGLLKTSSTSAPFTISWSTLAGTHKLQSKAYDAKLNYGWSNIVNVTK